MCVPCEHQSPTENSENRNSFTDLQAGKNTPDHCSHISEASQSSQMVIWILISFHFSFTCINGKSKFQLCEVGVKAGPRFVVLLHLSACSISEINQQGQICAVLVGIKLWLDVQGGNTWFLSPFAAGAPFPTSAEK